MDDDRAGGGVRARSRARAGPRTGVLRWRRGRGRREPRGRVGPAAHRPWPANPGREPRRGTGRGTAQRAPAGDRGPGRPVRAAGHGGARNRRARSGRAQRGDGPRGDRRRRADLRAGRATPARPGARRGSDGRRHRHRRARRHHQCDGRRDAARRDRDGVRGRGRHRPDDAPARRAGPRPRATARRARGDGHGGARGGLDPGPGPHRPVEHPGRRRGRRAGLPGGHRRHLDPPADHRRPRPGPGPRARAPAPEPGPRTAPRPAAGVGREAGALADLRGRRGHHLGGRPG